MQKEEAKITAKILKWFRAICHESAPFEIKHTHEKNIFMMNELLPHQKDWLRSCNSKHGCIWKIPDANIGYNPFDGFFYKNAAAYVIIVYPQEIIAIHIAKYLEIRTSSLLIEEARKLGKFKVQLKDL